MGCQLNPIGRSWLSRLSKANIRRSACVDCLLGRLVQLTLEVTHKAPTLGVGFFDAGGLLGQRGAGFGPVRRSKADHECNCRPD